MINKDIQNTTQKANDGVTQTQEHIRNEHSGVRVKYMLCYLIRLLIAINGNVTYQITANVWFSV